MKNDEKRDLLDFLTSNEAPPAHLKSLTLKDITFTMNKYFILLKFFSLQLLGAMITLSFCPQFGIGLPEGHGITHALRMYGDGVCATFCGSLFLLSGSLLTAFSMNEDQFFWIWRRYKIKLIFLPALFWAALMFFNFTWKLDKESWSYHVIWIISAILTQEIAMYIKTRFYSGDLKTKALS